MSFKAMAWAAGVTTGSPTRKLILLLLADRANDEGYCFPSLSTIADDCEIGDVSTVKRNIKVLEERGFVTVERRKKDGVNLPNIYHLPVGQQGVGAQKPEGRGSGSEGVGAQSPPNLSIEPIKEPVTKASFADQPCESAEGFTNSEAADQLHEYLIKKLGAAGIKPICKKRSNKEAFYKLFRAGVTAKQIGTAISFVTTQENIDDRYCPTVRSGSSLYDKWEKVETAMLRKQGAKERVVVKGNTVYFVDREKIGSSYLSRPLDSVDLSKYNVTKKEAA